VWTGLNGECVAEYYQRWLRRVCQSTVYNSCRPISSVWLYRLLDVDTHPPYTTRVMVKNRDDNHSSKLGSLIQTQFSGVLLNQYAYHHVTSSRGAPTSFDRRCAWNKSCTILWSTDDWMWTTTSYFLKGQFVKSHFFSYTNQFNNQMNTLVEHFNRSSSTRLLESYHGSVRHLSRYVGPDFSLW
jgi:hypothetical protein